MEMNFPHHALRQDSDISPKDSKSVLDAARLRQANSRTVQVLHQAVQGNVPEIDALAARIQCFTAEAQSMSAVRGAFWQKVEAEKTDEASVYQAASVNIKDQLLPVDETGIESTLVGHGAGKES